MIFPRSGFSKFLLQLDNDHQLTSEKQKYWGHRARFGGKEYWKYCVFRSVG